MTNEELQLLQDVKWACKKNPRFLEHIIHAGTNGIIEKTEEANKRALEFETIALAACANRYSNRLEFIKQKLSKLNTCFDWTSIFNKAK